MKRIEIRIEGRPYSKQRPRYSSRSRSFYTPTSKKEEIVKEKIKSIYDGDLISDDVDVFLSFHFNDKRIGDIDNYEKFILDCLQGTILKNDKQIKKLCSQIIMENDSYTLIRLKIM